MCAAGQGERGEHRDERGAQRRREETSALAPSRRWLNAARRRPGSGGERSEPPGKRSAQRAKRAEATGIAAEIGAKRRLERKARPRSGSPKSIAGATAPVSIIDTIVSVSVTVGATTGIVGIVRSIIVDTMSAIGIGVVTVSRRASSAVTATR